MALTDQQAFKDWRQRRIREDRWRGLDPLGETHCISCGGELDDITDETATCVTCLAVQFGHDQAAERIGAAASRLGGLIVSGDHHAIGSALSEIAEHAIEIVDARPPRV